jgi:membrane-bound lytic murein transglycosylase MltF
MPDGFDVELTKSLMHRIGKHNFKIVSMDWQDLLEFYDKHSNAVIMGMDRIGRRENKYNFGPVHSYTSHSVVYRRGSKKLLHFHN